jgi:iron complex outermembrane receptor protein
LRPTGYLDLTASQSIFDGIQIRLQAINLTNEHDVLDRPVLDALGQTSNLGRTFLVGVRLHL